MKIVKEKNITPKIFKKFFTFFFLSKILMFLGDLVFIIKALFFEFDEYVYLK